jgi:hypothetical protein
LGGRRERDRRVRRARLKDLGGLAEAVTRLAAIGAAQYAALLRPTSCAPTHQRPNGATRR